ncbi:hypothetical protein HS088_TW12G00044 [Tripterygium wilfordii]|uniref:Uncharacterized protein n=1 Tax=Tripterygium wilfordii TaxID=458696 RepID=A0A7J7CXM9_TRIWF|nr:uncharacterized protein LOC120011086 [Tripterygium wilfordii]XP_038718056.1 uncharacterized protein LOC120011086 [Tripterygium wilfordii]KAF5738851.1 hypothetical protein HS088_TW12G00044 [Tripterygium wilfordii]
METLVAVPQYRNQYHSGVKSHGHADRVGSSPYREFREISCRTFDSGEGILPTPYRFYSTPVAKRAPPLSPKTASPTDFSLSFETPLSKTTSFKSTPISIKTKNAKFCNDKMYKENLSFSERWAGPAYSNSPPPSCLPIPKFSVKAKRTVSLELPGNSDAVIDFHPTAKSAPASPTRAHKPSPNELFNGVDSATKTLRRILNLDATDE